jgi:plasmid stability protein
MRRTQIRLDEAAFQAIRRRAFQRGCSFSALVRELLGNALQSSETGKPRTLRDFRFVGSGRSEQGKSSPVSERHDEALVEALRKGHQER